MITPADYPIGTRVESTQNPQQCGTITGWVRDNIGIRWDTGGTSIQPAHHGGLRHKRDRIANICCGHAACQREVARAVTEALDAIEEENLAEAGDEAR